MATEVKNKDIELWTEWKRSQSPVALQRLLDQMSGIIAREVNNLVEMGVKFVTPKKGDAVAVVARSVEAAEEADDDLVAENGEASGSAHESPSAGEGATIDGSAAEAPASGDSSTQTDSTETGEHDTGESED